MRIPPWVHAALDGFTLGGLLSTGRPSAPTSIFPEEGHELEALNQIWAIAGRVSFSRRVTERQWQDLVAILSKKAVGREAPQRGEPARPSAPQTRAEARR